MISGPGVGTGPTITPIGLAMDSTGNLLTTAVLGNADTIGLFGVDLTTGNRSAVSTAHTGTGPFSEVPLEIALQSNGNVVMTLDVQSQILTIDPTTGNRTLLEREPGDRPLVCSSWRVRGPNARALDIGARRDRRSGTPCVATAFQEAIRRAMRARSVRGRSAVPGRGRCPRARSGRAGGGRPRLRPEIPARRTGETGRASNSATVRSSYVRLLQLLQ